MQPDPAALTRSFNRQANYRQDEGALVQRESWLRLKNFFLDKLFYVVTLLRSLLIFYVFNFQRGTKKMQFLASFHKIQINAGVHKSSVHKRQNTKFN